MAVRNFCRLLGQILAILALIVFVPTAMALFMLSDLVRWLISRVSRRGVEARRRQVEKPAWRTGASFG